MSFEGYYEYLCVNGHKSGCDVYNVEPKKCRACGGKIAYRCLVDQTNGIDEDDPSTLPGPVEIVGYDDSWKSDHHGNRYATMDKRYKPIGNRWRKV